MREIDIGSRREKKEISLNFREEDSSGSEMIDRFNDGLRQVVGTSKSELNRLLAEDWASRAGRETPGLKPRVKDAQSPRE
jgi:hypothetical protein